MYLIIGICSLLFVLKVILQKKSRFDPPVASNQLPLLGHLHFLLGNNAAGMWNILKKIFSECNEKGGVLTIYLGPRRLYIITDPEDCLTISNTCLNKDNLYNFAKNFVGNSIFTADATTWKTNRKLLNPAFNIKVLNSFTSTFNSKSRQLVDQLTTEEPFDMGEHLRLCALETICLTSIGSDFEDNKTLQKNYVNWQKEIMGILIERFMKFWLHQDCIYKLSSLKKKEDAVVKKMHSLSNSIIQQKKQEMKAVQSPNQLGNITGQFKPFMDLILELANETGCFTDDEVRGETDTIISGGHDTSGTTLTYAFILIGTYPEIQKKVYQEILHVIGKDDRDLNKDDLTKLIYIDAVLKETLRLYSIAPALGRTIDRDIKLKNFTLKANSSCILSIWGVHRHAIWGPDADQFRPERWLCPEALPSVNYFGGFSVGKRSCIGKAYAMMFMKTVVAHVVRHYRVKADITTLKLKLDVTLKPESGHYITLERRE